MRDGLVASNDLAPTFVQWAGVVAPDVDGRSLAPLLSEDESLWRDAFFIEDPGMEGVPGYVTLITHQHLYVEWETGERELYWFDDGSAPGREPARAGRGGGTRATCAQESPR